MEVYASVLSERRNSVQGKRSIHPRVQGPPFEQRIIGSDVAKGLVSHNIRKTAITILIVQVFKGPRYSSGRNLLGSLFPQFGQVSD